MRNINPLEQDVVNRIVNLGQTDLITLLDDFLENKNIALNFVQNQVFIEFDQGFLLQLQQIPVGVQNEILTTLLNITRTITFLEYLRQIHFIKLIQVLPNPNPAVFGRVIIGAQTIPFQIQDQEVVNLLLTNSYKTIVVEQPLIDYVEHGYITKEEKRHRENIAWVIRGIYATVFIGLATLTISIIEFTNKRCTTNDPSLGIEKTKIISSPSDSNITKGVRKPEVKILKVRITNDFSKDTITMRIE